MDFQAFFIFHSPCLSPPVAEVAGCITALKSGAAATPLFRAVYLLPKDETSTVKPKGSTFFFLWLRLKPIFLFQVKKQRKKRFLPPVEMTPQDSFTGRNLFFPPLPPTGDGFFKISPRAEKGSDHPNKLRQMLLQLFRLTSIMKPTSFVLPLLPSLRLLALLLVLVGHPLLSACAQGQQEQRAPTRSADGYELKKGADPTGIDKYYLGRQIADVMSHRGASWLERPDREQQQRTDLLIKALELKPTDVVVDLGAGSGYFTFRMSQLVPQGKVLAVDIQPEMLEMIQKKKREEHASNVETVLGTEDNPNLPANSVDLVLMVDAYHEFAYPREMMEAVVRALKPGGRLALVEYKAEDPSVPIRPLHKMTLEQAKKEMAVTGLQFRQNKDILPQQHLMFFQKPVE
jgi:ubiquinone/menaquinone biosynthesis C-methylase UbiE